MRHWILACLLIASSVSAAELKGGYAACVTEETFDQFIQALVDEDERGQQYLIENNLCIITKGGIPVTVLDWSWSGVSHVRAYVGDQAIELWTNSENIIRD